MEKAIYFIVVTLFGLISAQAGAITWYQAVRDPNSSGWHSSLNAVCEEHAAANLKAIGVVPSNRPRTVTCEDTSFDSYNRPRYVIRDTFYVIDTSGTRIPRDSTPFVYFARQRSEHVCPSGYTLDSAGDSCSASCSTGQTFDAQTGACINTTPPHNTCSSNTANPIDIIEGDKYRQEKVLSVGNIFPINFTYFYNSHAGMERLANGTSPSAGQVAAGHTDAVKTSPVLSSSQVSLAIQSRPALLTDKRQYAQQYWRHNYAQWLDITGSNYLWYRPQGRPIVFKKNGRSNVYPAMKVTSVGNKWQIDAPTQQRRYTFDATGNLIRITDTSMGQSHTISYEGDSQRIARIDHSLGQFVTLSYTDKKVNPAGVKPSFGNYTAPFVSQIEDQAGLVVDVEWKKSFRGRAQTYHLITAITHPYREASAGRRLFTYANTAYPMAMTRIEDQLTSDPDTRKLYAEFAYDSQGRATSSALADGVESVSVQYVDESTRKITNAFGKDSTYDFATENGAMRLKRIIGEPTATCVKTEMALAYDTEGLVKERARNDQITRYTYNERGLESQRTEAANTPEARTIKTEWHPTLNRRTKVTEARRTTYYSYDTAGRVLSMRVEADGSERTTRYTYTPQGLVATMDGPRTDVDDITRYTYDAQHNLTHVTNPLNQVTQWRDYDAHHRAQTVIDANGIQTRLRYFPRGWLKSSTVAHPSGDAKKNLTTAYDYDGIGQLIKITLPDGQSTQYKYDNARRLVATINHVGERRDFVLDAAGNPTKETLKDASANVVYQMSRQYDELSRLMKTVGAANQMTHIQYDANDNATQVTNGRQLSSTQEFDALNRVKKALDPLLADTQFSYDTDDQLTSVTDARGLKTEYVYNGFGELVKQISPDTGTTVFEYDAAGNRVKRTDAREVITHYHYDALNRLIEMRYPASPAENHRYTYDSTDNGNQGIGRMTQASDASGDTQYQYNYLGNLVSKTYTIADQSFSVRYAYDDDARLSQITYPSGRMIHYRYDTLSRIQSITTQASTSESAQAVVNDVQYLPFGPLQSWQYGNGVQHTLRYDQDYRLAEQKTEGTNALIHTDFSYDGNNNITAIDTPNRTAASQRFAYTDVDRIDTAKGLYGDIDYEYDVVGNRTLRKHTLGSDSTLETYHYSPISQRLQRVTSDSDEERNFGYDTNGNVISDLSGLVKSWIYNNQNRPASIKVGANTTRYLHNYRGQRTYKENGSNKHRFHYDDAGQLIAVSDQNGVFIEEHIWLYNNQVATLRTDMEAN